MTETQSIANSQNSELDDSAHPSGARIRKIIERANRANAQETPAGKDERISKDERGERGEILRPSEREDRDYVPHDEPVEGER